MLDCNGEPCPFCGETASVEVLEYWPEDRSFLLDTCCEDLHDYALDELGSLDKRELAKRFTGTTGFACRQLLVDETGWTVDAGLTLAAVDWAEARDFVALHHRHNAPPPGWKFGAGLRSGTELVAVMIAGRPGARNIDHRKIVEITRVCVKDMHPHALSWNACSMLYGSACRKAKKKGYEAAITYTRLDEPGTSLIAAGFYRDGTTKPGSWNRKKRPRPNAPEPCSKQRWRRDLKLGLHHPVQQFLF